MHPKISSISDRCAHLAFLAPVWICVNSAHFMLGYQYAKGKSIKISFMNVGHQDFKPWSSTLGVQIGKYSSLTLLPLLIRAICLKILRKNLPSFYLPHLSPHIFSPRQLFWLKLLRVIVPFSYFDDGMTTISKRGILWTQGYIYTSPEKVITWNYLFLRTRGLLGSASVVESYNNLTESFSRVYSANYWQDPFFDSMPKSKPITLIIASKWMNWQGLRKNYRIHGHNIIYVPHYRAAKNDDYFYRNSIRWEPSPNLELSLPKYMNRINYCYFAVTSSILYVFEILLAQDNIPSTIFIPLISIASADYPEEAKDFLCSIQSYNLNIQMPAP